MHRFFIPLESFNGETVHFPKNESRQLASVLRARTSDVVIALDNSGMEFIVELQHVAPTNVSGKIICTRKSLGDPRVKVTLFQSIIRQDKFEYVLQKGTEVGISTFVPISTERVMIKSSGLEKKYARWNRILKEAAEQCNRGSIPSLYFPESFPSALDTFTGLGLIPWEEEKQLGIQTFIRDVLHSEVEEISIFIGPEGGFTKQEISCALRNNITAITLGQRIFRTETAGLVTAAILLSNLGELGG